MKSSSLLGIVVTAVIACTNQCVAENTWHELIEVYDLRYTSVVTDKLLDATPPWADDQDNPPISAKRAIGLADSVRTDWLKGQESLSLKWTLRDVTLTHALGNKWFWVVGYEGHPSVGGTTGMPPYIHLIVLMNGEVVMPRKEE
jgi:hypothetical protein